MRHLPHSANIFRGAPPISLKKQVKTSKNVPKSPKCCSLPQPAAACRSLMQPLQPLQPAAACRSLPQPAILRLLTPPTLRGVIISQRILGFLGVIYDGVSRGKRAAPCINGPHTDRPKHVHHTRTDPHRSRSVAVRDATRTFWPEIPTVRRAARGLGVRPEAPLGPRLITFKRRFGPPESCPLAPPTASAAPR